jgi:endo-1,4-beta-xylanase
MKFSRTIVVVLAVLSAAMVFIWGCENQPTAPQVADNTQQTLSTGGLEKTAGTGSDHGYFWSLYTEGGSASISFPGAGSYAGNFAISWNNCNDVVGGKGWSSSGARTVGYNCGSISGTYKFFGVYGWTTNPLIEYYIAEKGSAAGGTSCGSVSSDGHTYSVYKQQRVNAPSIQGTKTFWQYKSSWGGSGSGNHSVNVGNHWNYWKAHCGSMGSGNYMILAVENWGGGSGYVNATVW